MAVRIESQAEPIPGYKLIERLGGGGFGEVWKAEAPGGLLKAIKFVYGEIKAVDASDSSRADQELKALSRVKTVHHPYILSLERFDIIDGQLIIVMELADRTLADRFRDCGAEGLPGIPREELLKYLEETAEALDLMNSQYQLQHLDIKPQNLFLMHNHVKVADFGLVKDLEGMAASVTGGVTPVYAAPETFDGWVSRFSDQYSLAIVYQELLTGIRPFAGTSLRQLVLQHIQAVPDLSSLPLADRPAIARALAKNPDERFPSCEEMIRALRQAGAPVGPGPFLPSPVEKAVVSPTSVPSPSPAAGSTGEAPGRSGEDPDITRHERGRRPQRPAQAEVFEEALAPEESPGAAPVLEQESPQEVRDSRLQDTSERPKPQEAKMAADYQKKMAAAVPILAEASRQPALILGLGGFGREVLRHFRQEVTEQVGPPKDVPHIRLLHLDTDPEAASAAGRGPEEARLQTSEVLVTKLHRPAYYLKPQMGKPPLESWLGSKVLYRIPRQQQNAGIRPLGRLVFVDHFPTFCRRVMSELEACMEAIRQGMVEGADQAMPSPRVYVVTSLGGGTGSGMFLDVAFVVRHLLKKMGYPRAEVVGLFLVPQVDRPGVLPAAVANAYAALTELRHFSSPGALYSALFESSEAGTNYLHFQEKGPPFQRCLVVDLAEPSSKTVSPLAQDVAVNRTLARAGQFLWTELLSPFGKVAAEIRTQLHPSPKDAFTQAPLVQACGMYRILWPRQRLLQMCAYYLCRRLVERWRTKDAKAISEHVASWVQRQWETYQLRLENLIARHQEGTEKRLGKVPELKFTEVIGPAQKALTPPGGTNPAEFSPNLGPVVLALHQLEELVGVPEECRPQQTGPITQATETPQLEKILAEAASQVASECEQKLAELVVFLIEDPQYRLAGAEEAIRQFNTLVEQALQNLEQLAKELQERAVLVYQRLHTLLEAPATSSPTGSLWKSFVRRPQAASHPGAELLELLRSYPKCRYQSLILQGITSLYLSLRGHLSDQMREIGFCRQRLGELADLIAQRSFPRTSLEKQAVANASLSVDCYLFPNHCPDFLSALQEAEEQLTPAEELAFDQHIQPIVRKQFGALVTVCMASSSVIRMLVPVLHEEAIAFLEPFLDEANVVDMFLERYRGEGGKSLFKQLGHAYEKAAATLAGAARGKHLCLVSLPGPTRGGPLWDTLRKLVPDARFLLSPRSEEIVIYREYAHLALTDLDQLGAQARDIYQQRMLAEPNCVHSRSDIMTWAGESGTS